MSVTNYLTVFSYGELAQKPQQTKNSQFLKQFKNVLSYLFILFYLSSTLTTN